MSNLDVEKGLDVPRLGKIYRLYYITWTLWKVVKLPEWNLKVIGAQPWIKRPITGKLEKKSLEKVWEMLACSLHNLRWWIPKFPDCECKLLVIRGSSGLFRNPGSVTRVLKFVTRVHHDSDLIEQSPWLEGLFLKEPLIHTHARGLLLLCHWWSPNINVDWHR